MITAKSTIRSGTFFALAVLMTMAGTAFPETYAVTNTNDSGSGSLRWAIESANSHSGADRIEFDIDGDGPHTIQPETPFPELNEEVAIDGYTQPGSAPATGVSNAVLKIILDGGSLPQDNQGLACLFINANTRACVIKGLVICNYPRNGILIASAAGGNVVEGNYIGTDYTGTVGQANSEFGIYIGNSPNNRIGGTTPAARNVISGNGADGVLIYESAASGNRVLGNFIGIDASGTSFLLNGTRVNGTGVGINNAPGNIIGGTGPGSRNVITAIEIGNPKATNNQVVGNYLGGINAAGNGPLSGGNPLDSGVLLGSGSRNVIGPDNVISVCPRPVLIWPEASYNTVRENSIGTDATGQVPIGYGLDGVTIHGSHNRIEGNVICGGVRDGVNIFPALGGEVPTQNIITRNAIYNNGAVGIDLGDDRVTPNDPGDTDTGPNNLVNFPVLESALATPGQLVVTGTIDTPNLMSVRLEFFASSAPDATGYGEGEIYLGAAKPNASGRFTAALPAVSPGMWISATATDKDGNTSEFALSIEAEGPGGGPLLTDDTLHEVRAASPDGGTGTILLEVWEDIGIGDMVEDLTGNPRYPDDPSWWMELTSFDFWDLGMIRYGYPLEMYGSRIRGYLHPRTSGEYTFWIASDNCSELWLSSDRDPDNAVLIADIHSGLDPDSDELLETWTDHYQWDKYPWQKSVPISLGGGQKYYIVSLHKEGVGGDGVCVAWQGLDCPVRAVIDGQFLSPYELTPEEQMERILRFIDRAVDEGTLQGEGPGNSSQNQLNAMRNMLEVAADLIEAGAHEDACGQLRAAYQKTDGDPIPPDFVSGPAAPELATMILELMADLGCK